MAIGDDFTVAVNGDIRHASGTTTYTVLEMHRWLQDLADDAAATGNDLIDITSDTPSERSTDNIISLNAPYNIDDDAAEYLYAGSISQAGGDTVYSGLQVLGAVNNASTQLMIIQNNQLYPFTTTPASPFWGTQATGGYNGDSTSGILMRILVKSRDNGADIDGKRIRVQARHWGDTYDFFNVNLGQGEAVAAVGTTQDPQNDTTQGTVTTYTHVVNSGGTANAPTGGYQTIDLNNGNGAFPYYSQWTYGADTSGDGLKGVWEYLKDLSGNGTTKTIDSLGGELFLGATHEIDYTGESGGPFTEREIISWGSALTYGTLAGGTFTAGNRVVFGNGAGGQIVYDNGTTTATIMLDSGASAPSGTDSITEYDNSGATGVTAVVSTFSGTGGGQGILLALNDAGTTGDLWIQQLVGSSPASGVTVRGNTSGATATTNGSASSKTVPKIFLGSYTGSLIGAYGIGVDPGDLTASDSITPLTGATQTPPNNVTFTVTGLVSGEDRVLVGPRSASILQKNQFALAANITTASTSVQIVSASIPSDTPSSGDIRVEDNSGIYQETPYSSYTGNVFTLTGTYASTANTDTAGNIFVGYIDELASATSASFTTVFSSSRDLFVRVRDGGVTPIKTFEAPASLGSSGGSIAAIRTSDA